ncbi:hypothetical protein HU200_033238 [Digitaria exilis]|uniref:Uncharacterized protein n=1 Tax=Digitaria exilis TaxID=1010633 RepID=A0A835EN54_9POAL|nr:hypothetical protein HU200_033238 [Digitaria exilis]
MGPAAAAAAPAPPPDAVVVNVATATVRRAATPSARDARILLRRVRWALVLVLLVLGFATASLAFFSLSILSPGQLRRPCSYSNSLSRSVAFPFQEGANQTNQPNALQGCARTEEEAAELRESSELLLVSASAQVLAATATLLVPVLPLALVAFMLGSYTAGRAADLVWMLLAYHRRVHGVAAFNYLVFYALALLVIMIAAIFVIARPPPAARPAPSQA